ncbi:tissue factor pathway inhibitor 2 [Drosophila albomicans]|uniref:Tissue factor pathway inhibitor 2 n=1 Tax=Drosophila albomicans TaxID=7291 RepID=A0A9C6T417_DROAB|nr:tissue factor pathway inhibitor 2 [Drosophila albomicans]
MKLILLFACFALLVVYNEAQRCRGRVARDERNCLGGRDSGTRRGDNCHRNSNDEMWYFSRRTRSCRRMSYRGCGGNKNRYCSLESCERKCVRPRPVDPITPQPNNPTTAAPADPTPAPAAD